MYNLALIIPCYNEEPRIRQTFEAYYNYLSNNTLLSNKKIAIILVNDGSQDKTADIINDLTKSSDDRIAVKAISYNNNQGKGAAIKLGCAEIDAEIYGFVDADLSFRPELISQVLAQVNAYDLVIGERTSDLAKSPYAKFRHSISKLLRKIINSFLGLLNIDTQCGFKFFNHRVAKNILPRVKQLRFSFDIELIILTQLANLKIKSLPINFEHRDTSSVTWKDGVRYILDTISISERLKTVGPKQLFGQLFILSTAISILVYGWVIFQGYIFSDDFTWLWHGQKIANSMTNILTFRMSSFYSPVMNAFYSVMYSLFGYDPQPLFFIGLLVHILVSFLSGVLAFQLIRSRLVSGVVVVLAAFAGGAYEPLVWIGANMHSFVTLFILSCLIFYYHYLATKKTLSLLFAFAFFIFAVGTKESAIITPALLLLLTLYYRLEQNKYILSKSIILYWSAIITLAGIYSYQQYLWQKSSIWVQSGIWQINFSSILRLPLIVLDNFIPLSFLTVHLTNLSAIFLWLFSLLFLALLLYKFRQLKLIWLGFVWLIITISPVIFFRTEYWWQPLASRYNYLPRFGAILIISVILHYLIVQNKSRHIISGLIYVVIITTFAQIYFMAATITTEYNYVYNTGRSLVRAMEKINQIGPQKIIVRWDHPFTANNAHLVGAVAIITDIREENIIFLKPDEPEELKNNQSVLLYWEPNLRQYEVKYNP